MINNAKTTDLKKFREITGYQGTLLTDPSRESYKLLQFKSDLTDLIGIKSFTQTFSAFKAGFMPGALQGNALQLGGAAIIDPEDNVKYFFQSSKAGDHPSIEDLLKAIE